VSIIVPCYNYGRFLGEAIESALAQTRPADEIIVIDDGSTDSTPEVLAHYRHHPSMRTIRQTNQGAIATFNTGIGQSHGAFFVVLSADDRLDPRFLERTVPALVAHPGVGYAYTGYRVFGARHRIRAALTYSRTRLARRPYFTASALIRREAFDAAGGYSADMAIGYEDWDLFLGMAERGWDGVAVPEALFQYRQHRVASRNTMSFFTWLSLLARIYRRHRALYRVPLAVFLACAIGEQHWLTLRAAPRAAFRRLGSRPCGGGQPGICLLTSSVVDAALPRRAAGSVPLTVLAQTGPQAYQEPPAGAAGVPQQTSSDSASGNGPLALAIKALYQRAAIYHAQGRATLLPAALAATANRALLIYECLPAECAPCRRRHLLTGLVAGRIDALIVKGAQAAAAWQRTYGVQPALRADTTAMRGEEARGVETQRLAQLYADMVALFRTADSAGDC
jgi:GT2 family glycosyltransferase